MINLSIIIPVKNEALNLQACLNSIREARCADVLYEILVMSEPVKQLMGSESELNPLRLQAMKEGMRTLRLSGARKIANGETTIEEVMRVAPAPANH